jgi:hypothetical protein
MSGASPTPSWLLSLRATSRGKCRFRMADTWAGSLHPRRRNGAMSPVLAAQAKAPLRGVRKRGHPSLRFMPRLGEAGLVCEGQTSLKLSDVCVGSVNSGDHCARARTPSRALAQSRGLGNCQVASSSLLSLLTLRLPSSQPWRGAAVWPATSMAARLRTSSDGRQDDILASSTAVSRGYHNRGVLRSGQPAISRTSPGFTSPRT